MINAVGREIPDEILRQTGKEPFQGNNYKNGVPFRRYAPIIRPVMDNQHSKLVANIREALIRCKAHSGMTVSFHHHFREGDLIVNMVMKEIHDMGFKNITLAATSLGKAHDPLVPMIEDGTITSIQASGVRGKIGEAISHGKLKGLAIMRSHGGRVRSLVTGETKVDIAFIGAPKGSTATTSLSTNKMCVGLLNSLPDCPPRHVYVCCICVELKPNGLSHSCRKASGDGSSANRTSDTVCVSDVLSFVTSSSNCSRIA